VAKPDFLASALATPCDAKHTARTALACLDLTSLNDGDSAADIERLCKRASGPFGTTAAVCVWPRFAALARARLPTGVAVAAVANFPDGGTDIARAVADTQDIVAAGAEEVDLVLPYRALRAGDERSCTALLAAVRAACPGLRLKVILETGELQDAALIRRAAALALQAGADFLKTSTGKTPVSATPAAARLLLQAIAADPAARGHVGFKPAGGIRTVADAAIYIALVRETLGEDAVSPARFRIGASGLLNDIETVLGGAATPAAVGY
jgi:deoxyribose-phosphate aldolase